MFDYYNTWKKFENILDKIKIEKKINDEKWLRYNNEYI